LIGDVVLGLVAGTMLAYAAVSLAVIWRERPVVVWDEREQRWRAADRVGPRT
jgi:hypothetical protein